MQHIKDINELKSLGREKGLQLLAYKEKMGTLDKFIKRIDHNKNYIVGNEVMVFSLLKDLGW